MAHTNTAIRTTPATSSIPMDTASTARRTAECTRSMRSRRRAQRNLAEVEWALGEEDGVATKTAIDPLMRIFKHPTSQHDYMHWKEEDQARAHAPILSWSKRTSAQNDSKPQHVPYADSQFAAGA